MLNSVIKVLLIDDAEEYGYELKGVAAEKNIEVINYTNLQVALEENPLLQAIKFIILDAHCIKDEIDTAPDFDFLPTALLELEKIFTKNGRRIPFCINTGYAEDDKLKRYHKTEKVFNKSSDISEMLEYIIEMVNNDDEFQFKCANNEIFQLFELQILSPEHLKELIEVYKSIKSYEPLEIKSTIRRIRPIIETSFKKLKQTDNNLIPDSYFKNDEPNVSGIIYHLGGKKKYNKETERTEYHSERVLPDHVKVSLDCLYDITSKVAMHDYTIKVSENIVKSCYYSLLEYLYWLHTFYTNNYLK